MTTEGLTSSDETARDTDGGPPKCAAVLQPLVRFGVTGHRDLADVEAASRSVTEALGLVLLTLDSARRQGRVRHLAAPSATAPGYQIVSPLAEGADRVVASMVLSSDARLRTRRRELVVPLPFPLDYYRGTEDHPGSDCSDAASQAEFDRLHAVACWTRALHAYAPSNDPQRDAGYRDVGKFVVEHSDLVVALWDGVDSGLEGGTSAVVRLALQRGIPVIWVPVTRKGQADKAAPSRQGAGPKLLLAPTTSGDELAIAVQAAFWLPSPMAAAALSGHRKAQQPVQELLVERLERLDELSRSASKSDQASDDRTAPGSDPAQAAPATSDVLAAVSRWIDPTYELTDGLAKRYQFRLKVLTIGVYAAAATAVALGALAAILFPFGGAWRLPVVFEAIVLVALLAVQWLDLRKTCRDRWVAFRAMSEYQRIGRYLALVTPKITSGLDLNRVVRLNAWSSEASLIPWFGPVLERIWDRRPIAQFSDHDALWLRNHIVTDWIDGQITYHQGRRDYHERWDRILRWAIRGTLFATVLAIALHAVRAYYPAFLFGRQTGSRDLISANLAFLVIVLTSVAAAFNGYAGQQRHAYHRARFGRMARELSTIRTEVYRAISIGQLRQSISEVRRVTLSEATDWFEDMRDQEIDSPT
jgi:hypothetical protein